jgi:hypothetical protein
VAPKVYDAGTSSSATTANTTSSTNLTKAVIAKPDASMPDSLNKHFIRSKNCGNVLLM